MGSDDLFKRRKNARKERRSKAIELRNEQWLIVCEGAKTEPEYFRNLINDVNDKSNKKVICEIKGTGKNTETLVSHVDKLVQVDDETLRKHIPYAKVFVAFDKDSFREEQFNNAIYNALRSGYIPLWSNQCFELWFILHYEFMNSDLYRTQYFEKLSGIFNCSYEKAADHYNMLGGMKRIRKAYENAKRLYNRYINEGETRPYKMAPCTTVFRLIDELESYTGTRIE